MCPVCGADHDRDYVYSIEQDQSIKYVLNFKQKIKTNALKVSVAATSLQFFITSNCYFESSMRVSGFSGFCDSAISCTLHTHYRTLITVRTDLNLHLS